MLEGTPFNPSTSIVGSKDRRRRLRYFAAAIITAVMNTAVVTSCGGLPTAVEPTVTPTPVPSPTPIRIANSTPTPASGTWQPLPTAVPYTPTPIPAELDRATSPLLEDVAPYIALGIPGAVITLMVVGLVWSPVAALICLLIASVRGLREEGYGSAGFRYSVLFLLPWIYLALRMAGMPPSKVVERIGYALLYGLWGLLALVFIGVGSAIAWYTALDIQAGRFPDDNEDSLSFVAGLAMVVVGMAIAIWWFISLRRLLRRHVLGDLSRSDTGQDYQPSPPMRTAYVALNVLWVLGIVTASAAGIVNVVFRGPLCPGGAIPVWLAGIMPFWICAAVMVLTWNWARKRFTLKTADSWDYPPSPTPNLLPPDDAYIAPYSHFYRMIVIPIPVGLALLVISFILYLMGGGDFSSC